MVEYHAESLNLQQAAADSIHRYQLKVADMAEVYPAVKSESLYRQIVQNIYNAYLVVGIKPGEWDDAEQISFTFGNE